MISAAEARKFAKDPFELQLEKIDHSIKEAILSGRTETSIYYKTGSLDSLVLEFVDALGYKVYTAENSLGYSDTKISWEE